MKTPQQFFEENNFVVIKNFIDPNYSRIFYQYTITKVQSIDYKIFHNPTHYNQDWDGKFGDQQIPNSYNCYGDPLMDSLLISGLSQMEEYTGLQLVPTYSYWRFYQYGDQLKKHKDRVSCEVSATVCLGYNLGKENAPEAWPIFVESPNNKEPARIDLQPGDMLIYKGCLLEHWREKFAGMNHSQVFLHYNRKDDINNNVLDGRSILGIPHGF